MKTDKDVDWLGHPKSYLEALTLSLQGLSLSPCHVRTEEEGGHPQARRRALTMNRATQDLDWVYFIACFFYFSLLLK